MDKQSAINLIRETFEKPFEKERYIKFVKNLFNKISLEPFEFYGQYIPEAFKLYINKYERIGKYESEDKRIDILIVYLNKETSIERARTMQRNFIAGYLTGKYGSDTEKDAAIVAFVSPGLEDWRFSLVKMEYKLTQTKTGRPKGEEEFTPAKRWSFLVGKNEKSHTAQCRFVPILENNTWSPTLEDLEEAFNVEVVTKEFFQKYRDLFIRTKLELDKIIKKDSAVKQEFESKNINTVDFAKKLLGQITFLYFLQKKGWFGVEKGKSWGTGPRDFMRKIFNKEYGDYKNFFNDILEPLFYEALRSDRSDADHYYSKFDCKLPFLNGGLFDPINNYNWVEKDIFISNELFSNTNRTKEGDIGDGILDVFDRYNFTVNEDEPLEKEVALDPELLGKIYEKLNTIREDNFDEYVKVLKSGKKGEETKFNKEYGVYYTPREIVHYMCQESLINYLETHLSLQRENIERFVKISDAVLEREITSSQKQQAIENGEIKSTKYESQIPEDIRNNAKEIDNLLANITVCDPAVGSGAFPMGMLHEIVKLRRLLSIYLKEDRKTYDLKRHCIESSLYGVDIDPGAVEICKLRFWLSLIVDEEDFHNIKPLPNLDYKVSCGNSLLGVEKNLFNQQAFAELEKLKPQYFNETNPTKKQKLKEKIDKLIYEISNGHKEFDFEVYFSEVFHEKKGFDIVIANPPYISTKGVDEEMKKSLEKHYGFADDTYNHFYFKGIEVLRENGILAYISSKTFWTIQTKKNLRELLLKNKILQLFNTANPFENAMVDTCVTIIQKLNPKVDHIVTFLDGRENLLNPTKYSIQQNDYKNCPNQVFFIPTDYNKKIYERFGKIVNKLLIDWWDKISTSKNIEKFKAELEQYRNNLKPGDVTLLGLITEGGVGIQTGNNGKYIGVLEGTKWAENVRKQRPKKLLFASKFCEENGIRTKQQAQDFLNSLSEKRIRQLFDELKEKYGRDIFGQGWLYRIVSPDETADVENLTEDEKLNGIKGSKTFVPYDKGDKEGNCWYAPTPYYIDWSRENVKFLKENSGKKGEGMPVVRNPQFYFREGFCWTDVSKDIKARIKEVSIHDVLTMSLFQIILDAKYFVAILNSKLMSIYLNSFVNTTIHFQINDARQLPIIIPTSEQLKQFENIFNRAYNIQKQIFSEQLKDNEADNELEIIQKELDKELEIIQKELDKMVEEMYMG